MGKATACQFPIHLPFPHLAAMSYSPFLPAPERDWKIRSLRREATEGSLYRVQHSRKLRIHRGEAVYARQRSQGRFPHRTSVEVAGEAGSDTPTIPNPQQVEWLRGQRHQPHVIHVLRVKTWSKKA